MKFREKILIITISFLVILGLIIFFLIIPLSQTIAETSKQIEEQRIVYEINKKRSENMASFQKDLEKIEAQNEALKNMLINESNQLNFFRDLEEIAQANSLSLSYNLEDISKKTQSPKEVLITINLEGKYVNTLKFIAGLESLDYYLKINTLVF